MIPFVATKAHVSNRGVPPDGFLHALVGWAQGASEDIFSPNQVDDVYTLVKPALGPWESPLHRRAALCEVMRVHAGFESSWNWAEGVDRTNATSMHNIEGQETGIFQVSFDSLRLGHGALLSFAKQREIETPQAFIVKMKMDHLLALEYYARLVRVSYAWAGPLKRKEVIPWLSRPAVAEFQHLLSV